MPFVADVGLQGQSQSPATGKYRPSPRPAVRTGPAAAAQAGEEEAIETFGLGLLVPEWTERMRRWISTMIVQPLVQRIVELETVCEGNFFFVFCFLFIICWLAERHSVASPAAGAGGGGDGDPQEHAQRLP